MHGVMPLPLPLPLLVALAVAGFAVVFAGLWSVVCYVLAQVGGWSALAERYRAAAPPVGTRHAVVHGAVGAVEYKGSLTVSIGPEGFRLSVSRLLKPGHPDLFIPWAAVTARADRKFLRWESVRLTIGQPAVATITLPKPILDGHGMR